jgi:hypothetical protein
VRRLGMRRAIFASPQEEPGQSQGQGPPP